MVLATIGASRAEGARIAGGDRNVGDVDRALSVMVGSALASFGLRRRGLPGFALAILGAELLRRGATGHCRLYRALGITSATDGRFGALPHRPDVTSRAATVNARRAVKIERSVIVLRPAAELYAFWRDFANLPRFMQHLERVECLEAGRSHWVARLPGGERVEWDAQIVNEIENELIAWKTVGHPDVAHAGSVHFRAARGGRGTEVRLVLDFEPPATEVIGGAGRALGRAPDALIRDELHRFKQVIESAPQ